jgi:hypothetical protein
VLLSEGLAEIWKTIEVGKWFDPAFLQVDLCLHLHRNQAPASGSSYLSSISLSTLCFCISAIDPGESGKDTKQERTVSLIIFHIV